MHVKVLGTGCRTCQKLYDAAQDAIAKAGIDASLEKVEDIDAIMAYDVMLTPALVIDEEVVSSGKLPKVDQIVRWLGERG